MEVQDGFIVGVFNYCDRWCERCSLTSHCRVFADHAEMEAALDPGLKAIVDAPPLAKDVELPSPCWMQELLQEMNDASKEPPSPEEWERIRPRVPADHAAIDARGRDYAVRTYRWLTETDRELDRTAASPHDVIAWFHFFIAAKINRALTVWPDEGAEDLVWLGEALERVRPNARAFVRPGFDEPQAVAMLLADEGGRRRTCHRSSRSRLS